MQAPFEAYVYHMLSLFQSYVITILILFDLFVNAI